MAKKASLVQWKELYELANKIQKLEPWKDFYDMDLFAIEPKGYKEPIFISIMGHAGNCLGISAYEGVLGYSRICEIAESENSICPTRFILGNQDAMVCYFGDFDELSDYDEELLDKLGLSYEEGEWIYFLSFQRRYYPYQLDAREVQTLIDVYKGFIFVLEEYQEFEYHPDFDREVYMVSMDEEDNWYSYTVPKPIPLSLYDSVAITDQDFLEHLKTCSSCDIELAMDLDYLFEGAFVEDIERPVNPLLFIAYDLSTDELITCDLVEIDITEVDAVMMTFFGIIDEFGKPNKVYARNPLILTALQNVCEELGIEIVEDPLEEIDDLIENIKSSL